MMYYEYYQNDANDNTVILIHGWGSFSKSLSLIKDELIDSYNVLLMDLKGFGKSKLNKVYHLDDYCFDIKNLLDKLKIENPIGIGHSFGGKVLMRYQELFPIKGLLLIAPSVIKPRFSLIKKIKILIYKLFKKIGVNISSFGSADYRKTKGELRKTFLNVVNYYFDKKRLNNIDKLIYLVGFKEDKEVKIYQLKKAKKQLKQAKLFIFEGDHFGYFYHVKSIRLLVDDIKRITCNDI